ncbi:(S)-1-Phenylethanol dehydrogenase [compost metagenome]
MNGRLTDKVAIVAGGTRGIGRAIAGRFLAEGARVVVAGRSEPGAHGVDGGALFFRADVASAGDSRRWWTSITALEGRTAELKAAVLRATANVVADALAVPLEQVFAEYRDIPKGQAFSGGSIC